MAQRFKRTLTVAERVDMIKCLENNESQVSVATKFGVHQSQVSRIKKNRDRILKGWNLNSNPYRKRIRTGKSEDIENALLCWFNQARGRQIPVTGPLLRRKAGKLARDFGLTDFKVTTGWLERWKARHAIKLRRRNGSRREVDDFAVEAWVMQVLPGILCDGENDGEREEDVPIDDVENDVMSRVSVDDYLSETSVDSACSVSSLQPTLATDNEQDNTDVVQNDNDDTVSLVNVGQCLHVIRRFMEQKGCRSYEPLYDLQDLLVRLNRQDDQPASICKWPPLS